MIAAKERGPGPGRYQLPSSVGSTAHDVTKKKAPGYSFGTKLPNSIIKKSDGPGPKDNVAPSMTRTGKQSAPAYSMGSRPSGFKLGRTPAPGAYSPEKVKIDKGKTPPAYTMRARVAGRKTDQTPAANTYNLKSTVGVAPKYSMTSRSANGGFAQDHAKAPGPGKYNATNPDKFKKKGAAYSMGGRTYMPEDQTKKPGPGAHNPEKVVANKKNAPAFSMGVRHSEYLTPLIVDVPDV
jgi:hypothetical protein